MIGIDPLYVQHFSIGNACYPIYPCLHDCEIVLITGSKRERRLSAGTIISLLGSIEEQNVESRWDVRHFRTWYELEKANTILLRIFGENEKDLLDDFLNSACVNTMDDLSESGDFEDDIQLLEEKKAGKQEVENRVSKRRRFLSRFIHKLHSK